ENGISKFPMGIYQRGYGCAPRVREQERRDVASDLGPAARARCDVRRAGRQWDVVPNAIAVAYSLTSCGQAAVCCMNCIGLWANSASAASSKPARLPAIDAMKR